MSALSVIVSAAGGAVAGGLTALLTPWAQWGVEKRRARLQWRTKFVADMRESSSRWWSDLPADIRRLEIDQYEDLITEGWFQTLSPYMTGEERKELDKISGAQESSIRIVAAVLIRLEREWNLA